MRKISPRKLSIVSNAKSPRAAPQSVTVAYQRVEYSGMSANSICPTQAKRISTREKRMKKTKMSCNIWPMILTRGPSKRVMRILLISLNQIIAIRKAVRSVRYASVLQYYNFSTLVAPGRVPRRCSYAMILGMRVRMNSMRRRYIQRLKVNLRPDFLWNMYMEGMITISKEMKSVMNENALRFMNNQPAFSSRKSLLAVFVVSCK